MKSKILFFTLLMVLQTAITVKAQQPVYPKPNSIDNIPFGKKLPPPLNIDQLNYTRKSQAGINTLNNQSHPNLSQLMATRSIHPVSTAATNVATENSANVMNPSSNFHLTKDINTHGEPLSSYPSNYKASPNRDNFYLSFAVLKKVSYFSADDGIHGAELWRSDGTAKGTFLVKDINPGAASSNPNSIIVANGKVYFSAYTDATSWAPWVSDGTEACTKLIKDIGGVSPNYPEQLINVKNTIFFTVNSDFGSKLWKTDGTPEGTFLVYDFNAADQYAGYITEATAANGLLFFSASTPTYGRELWRSDGTTAGTYLVKDIGPDQSDYYSPLQLTAYNNKLYFSGDDGTGRKLWVSDGTADGTLNVSGNQDIIVQTDFLDYSFNYPFQVLNNILYLAAYSYAAGNGLYKYDASNTNGLVLVKNITSGIGVNYIVPTALIKAGNALYFKAINSTGGFHDDLWTSNGETENTQIVKTFEPGHVTTNYYDGYGTLYFNEDDPTYGAELWKSNGTDESTNLVKDIFPGSESARPAFITPANGKIIFNATDPQYGTELWSTDGTSIGTVLIKDISVLTDGSDAGLFYKGIARDGNNGVVFGAFTPELGGELYKSDGTGKGTKLLNDIATGPDWSYPNSFIFKNGVNYFIADNLIGTSIYKTDGTKEGLKQIVYNIDRAVTNFNVTDNGLPFYILANINTGAYELWRSDGTQSGTYALNTSLYYNDYIVTIGNTAFFAAGDNDHGFELWKSDGTVAGTKMVKDINPGINGSYPFSLFAYKKEVYFGAGDGGLNSSFWKSDGTEKGTTKLKNITPAFYDYSNNFKVQYFCISNNILYFDATDFNEFGAELWKTDGTKAGTKLVKNINSFSSYPSNLTDVNGTLYFIADDGIHGSELWSSNGKSSSTKLVKDITPDFGGSNLHDLTNVNGQLYFVKDDILWRSNGTEQNTNPVVDEGLNGLSGLTNLTAAGNKLFFGAYFHNYGNELYAGSATEHFAPAEIMVNRPSYSPKVNDVFEAKLLTNPVNDQLKFTVNIKTQQAAQILITDALGRILIADKQTLSPGNKIFSYDTKAWMQGMYIIRIVTTDGSSFLLKAVK